MRNVFTVLASDPTQGNVIRYMHVASGTDYEATIKAICAIEGQTVKSILPGIV